MRITKERNKINEIKLNISYNFAFTFAVNNV